MRRKKRRRRRRTTTALGRPSHGMIWSAGMTRLCHRWALLVASLGARGGGHTLEDSRSEPPCSIRAFYGAPRAGGIKPPCPVWTFNGGLRTGGIRPPCLI